MTDPTNPPVTDMCGIYFDLESWESYLRAFAAPLARHAGIEPARYRTATPAGCSEGTREPGRHRGRRPAGASRTGSGTSPSGHGRPVVDIGAGTGRQGCGHRDRSHAGHADILRERIDGAVGR
ncbi:DinB family protein [Crossiella sp. SN42]|uniref:DinB family protein n=1 Tax=Crossiella sp. SN42 TaxID=2944808 RepID=UPI00207CF3E0|nr:DinB family protein [Crossiella sp. SN42]MCO1580732.1 DinB family protein [Crossiella sp. SN42]